MSEIHYNSADFMFGIEEAPPEPAQYRIINNRTNNVTEYLFIPRLDAMIVLYRGKYEPRPL